MSSPFTAIENPLVSASQATRDFRYREALWASAALTSVAGYAAFSEWSTLGSAILFGELLVLMESVAIYALAALAVHLAPRTAALVQFLAGILFGLLAAFAILNSLTLSLAPEALSPAALLRLFALAVAIELLSILALLQKRQEITSLAEILKPRIFAWIGHCALLMTAICAVVAPISQVDGVLGLSVAVMCLLSAVDCINDTCSRLCL
jgi:hypothetical protein